MIVVQYKSGDWYFLCKHGWTTWFVSGPNAWLVRREVRHG
jgi:hypothetical protein